MLVVGNELDHKDVRQTVGLLSTAFPFQELVVLGVRLEPSAILRSYPPAVCPRRKSSVCIPAPGASSSRPFTKGLASRSSRLWRMGRRQGAPICSRDAHCGSGRLIAFARRELVGIVGRLLRGEPVPTEPIGTAAGQARRWMDVAEDVVSFMDSRLRPLSGVRWRERDHAVNQLLAFRAGSAYHISR